MFVLTVIVLNGDGSCVVVAELHSPTCVCHDTEFHLERLEGVLQHRVVCDAYSYALGACCTRWKVHRGLEGVVVTASWEKRRRGQSLVNPHCSRL